jgi:glucose/mannose-6-phosphate isomerase
LEEKEAIKILDDREHMMEIDRENMLSSILKLPEQLIEGMESGNRVDIPYFRPENIVVCGMGGSAIAGDIVESWLSERLHIPFITNRNYHIPSFVSENTLVLAISYSGNTYEVINMVEEAMEKGAKVIGISSGGKLREMLEDDYYFIDIPSGMQSRAALGYLVASMGSVMKSLNIYDPDVEILAISAHLKALREKLAPSRNYEDNEAKKIAYKLFGTTPVIYSYGSYVSAANRWHTQINENSKVLSFYGELTEMNHNEMVGWASSVDGFSAVFLRGNESELLSKVVDFTKNVIEKNGGRTVDVWAEGEGSLERMFSLIYKGDFVSYYLAMLKGIDPTPEKVIEAMEKIL